MSDQEEFANLTFDDYKLLKTKLAKANYLLSIDKCRKAEAQLKLPALMHEIWCHWAEYMLSCATTFADGFWLPREVYEKWTRQKSTTYQDLPDEEKKSDIRLAHKIIDEIWGNQ